MSIVQRLIEIFEKQQRLSDCWCCGDADSTTDSADGGGDSPRRRRRRPRRAGTQRRSRQVRFQTHRTTGKVLSGDGRRSRRRPNGRDRGGSWSADRSGNTSGSSTQDTTATEDSADRSLSCSTPSPRRPRNHGSAFGVASGSARTSSLRKGTTGDVVAQHLGYVDTWPRPSRTLSDDWSEMLDISAHPNASFDVEDQPRDEYSWDTPQKYDSGIPPSNPSVPITNDAEPSTPRREFSLSTNSHLHLRSRSGHDDALDALLELAALCWPIDCDLDDGDRRRVGPDVLGAARAPEILWEAMAKFPLSVSVHVEAFRVATHLAEYSPTFRRTATAGPVPRPADGAWDRAAPRLLEPILAGMRRFWTDEDVQVYGTGALLMMVRHSEARTELLMEQLQGGTVVVAAMKNFLGCRDLQELGLLLFAMAGDIPRLRLPLVKVGGLRVAEAVLQWHSDDEAMVELALEIIATLCDVRRGIDPGEGLPALRPSDQPTRRKTPQSDTDQESSNELEVPYLESNCDELAVSLVRTILGRAETY